MNKEILIELQDTEWEYKFTDHDREIVRAIVYDDNGYFYFAQLIRNDIFCNGRVVETSGGGVEKGEKLDDAIHRELTQGRAWSRC